MHGLNALSLNDQFPYPQITFIYDWQNHCLDLLGGVVFNKVTSSHKEQLKQLLPQLIKAWEHNSILFFNELFSYFAREFKQPKRTAHLYLSHNASYGSNHFLILGLQHYITSETWQCSLNKEDCFCDLVFHELLHVWVEDNINPNSLLHKKYHNENPDVLDHIHLMAIQKMVYSNINQVDMLNWIDKAYRNLATKDYRRAWEIVNDIEGHEKVLQDIRDNLID